jgi:hypothetical protein
MYSARDRALRYTKGTLGQDQHNSCLLSLGAGHWKTFHPNRLRLRSEVTTDSHDRRLWTAVDRGMLGCDLSGNGQKTGGEHFCSRRWRKVRIELSKKIDGGPVDEEEPTTRRQDDRAGETKPCRMIVLT